MPHKRAKRSVREKQRSANGTNLAPGALALSTEAIPKGAARVLNAAKVQAEFHQKRRGEDDGSRPAKKRRTEPQEGKGKAAMKIMPGESLAHFNRRVEESMRSSVREAVQTSAAVARKVKKEEEEEKAARKASNSSKPARPASPTPQSKKKAGKAPAIDESDEEEPAAKPAKGGKAEKEKPTDFAAYKASAPRRLNDIAEAPPEFKKLPRGAKASKTADVSAKGTTSLRDGLLSMAQKAMLEGERERVIRAYRELKKRGATAV
ncbi:hypothetical protein PsYK624_015010 [Phanerochaete sordida]|uniref:Uncharacterized protein n=1 Tax=Phanerochaete sordida TaxID=48140 RepID=A0A9P3L971_9APHY|nr:hypothetical protein PsYK624_015010 [Phanerochaete sordida]